MAHQRHRGVATPRLRGPVARSVKRLRRAVRWMDRHLPERWWLILRVVRWIYSADYEAAQATAREIAVRPGMRFVAPPPLHAAVQENLVRHLAAAEAFSAAAYREPRHRVNWLLEMAYFALKERGR